MKHHPLPYSNPFYYTAFGRLPWREGVQDGVYANRSKGTFKVQKSLSISWARDALDGNVKSTT